MASVMKCSSCPTLIDVAGFAPGSVVQCPSCNAQVRIPGAGTTRMAAAAPPPPSPARKTGTVRASGPARSARTRAFPSKKSSMPMIVGIAVLTLAAIGGLIFLGNRGGEETDEPVAAKKEKAEEKPKVDEKKKAAEEAKKQKDQEEAAAKAAELQKKLEEEEKKKAAEEQAAKEKEEQATKEAEAAAPKKPEEISIAGPDGKEIKTFAAFVGGAKEKIKKDYYPLPDVSQEVQDQTLAMMQSGRSDDVLAKAYVYFKPALHMLMEDNEKVVMSTVDFLNKFCVLYKVLNPETQKAFEIVPQAMNHPDNRVMAYIMFLNFMDSFTEQFKKHERYGDPWADPKRYEVDKMPWKTIIRDLKHYQHSKNPDREGPYGYDEGTQGGNALKKLREMEGFVKDAYPYLLAYLGSDDPGHRKAAWVAINKLTELNIWRPEPKTQEEGIKLQKEFMRHLEISELPAVPE